MLYPMDPLKCVSVELGSSIKTVYKCIHMYVFFKNFNGILPHKCFPKQGLLKEAGTQLQWT